jgi:hypothetical protein
MLRKISLLLFSSFSLIAQSPSLDKAPQDVDDALRGRIKAFYDLHVQRKFRQAEQLVAEESKDDFYSMSKLEINDYRIANIEYSDNFTKAKALVVGKIKPLLPMFGAEQMEMPFASFWKIEDGKWCWYFNRDFARHTPFGDVKNPANAKADPNGGPASLPTRPQVSIEALQNAVKVDRTELQLKRNETVIVNITNTLSGSVSLQVGCPAAPMEATGVKAEFGTTTLKANESTTLKLTGGEGMRTGTLTLRISVTPTNQIIDLKVKSPG